MIQATLLALALGQARGVPIVVEHQPTSGVVCVQAVIRIPGPTSRGYAAAHLLEEVLLKETEEYSENQILAWGRQAGVEPQVIAQPDRIFVRLTFPSGQGKNAIYLMDSIVRRSVLRPERIEPALRSKRSQSSDWWLANELPWRIDTKPLTIQEVMTFWRTIAVPENVVIGLGGVVTPELIQAANDRFSDWVPAPPKRSVASSQPTPVSPLLQYPGSLHAFRWEGPLVQSNSGRLPAAILASMALGVGKGSSWFKTARESMGLSYFAQGVFWPEAGGIRTRLFACHDGVWSHETAPKIRAALEADVEQWSQQTLDRALGMAQLTLTTSSGPSAYSLGLGRDHHGGIADQTLFAAVWRSSTGEAWNATDWLARMRSVSLEDFKNEGRFVVREGQFAVVLGAAGKTEKPVP